MDMNKTLATLKQEPGFAENVGMTLIHNGSVRAWSRKDHQDVTAVEVTPDLEGIEALRQEYEKKPGIFRVIVDAKSGRLVPGDDLLFIVVAGDIRENVKPVLAELLDRIKAECIRKREIMA